MGPSAPCSSAPGYRLVPASSADAALIARVVAETSGGYAELGWAARRREFPGLRPLQIGTELYRRDQQPFTWRNCTVARAGTPLGLMLSYAIGPAQPPQPRDPTDVYDAVRMEVPESWYICAMAVLAPWRGRGIGGRFLELARQRARSGGLTRVSLIVFSGNVDALRLYRRHGYRLVESRQLPGHPALRYRGEALLMSAPAAGSV